jgi:hypothetical protein
MYEIRYPIEQVDLGICSGKQQLNIKTALNK